MMKMTDLFKPSILLSETHFLYRNVGGALAGAVERIADEGFFRGIEIPDIKDHTDRQRIGQIVHNSKLTLTMWMSTVLMTKELNLSSLDETIRKKSVAWLKKYMDAAAECGVSRFAVLSGPDPGPNLRVYATGKLYTSLCELCEAILEFGSMRIVLEPLDRGAHKNGLIGPTNDFVPLINRVRKSYSNIALSWDSSHVALCGDNIFESLTISKDLIDGIHLGNAILDRSDKMFGDYHMKIGKPGFLAIEVVAAIFKKAIEIGLFGRGRPCVSVEVRTPNGEDPWGIEAHCRKVIHEAWTIIIEREFRSYAST